MARAILGRKIAMSQFFTDDGTVVPVTVVEAGPCAVLQVKSAATVDGYRALQLGFDRQKIHRVTKPLAGHFAAAHAEPVRWIREVDYPEGKDYKAGDTVTCEIFLPGDMVDVIGTSKGKGFAGTVKRHHFTTGPKTHGSKNYREPGSTGQHTWPSRVFRGKKMPGHLGDARRTVQNLKVVRVDATNNLVYIRGSVPGANGGYVIVRHAKKSGRFSAAGQKVKAAAPPTKAGASKSGVKKS